MGQAERDAQEDHEFRAENCVRKRFIALGLLILFGPLDAGCWMVWNSFKWFIAAGNHAYELLSGTFFFDFSIGIFTICLSTFLFFYFFKKALPSRVSTSREPQNPAHV